MKRIVLLISILAAVSAFADDDGERVGCWNTTSIDYSWPLEASLQGMIFEFSGITGQDADSGAFYIVNSGASKEVKVALYRLWPGTQWTLVDSTNWRDLPSSSDTVSQSFDFQLGYVLVPDPDSLYCLVAWGESAGGSMFAHAIDSTGAEGIRQAIGGRDHSTTAWYATLPGNTGNLNTNIVAHLYYDVAAAPSGYVQPIIIEE